MTAVALIFLIAFSDTLSAEDVGPESERIMRVSLLDEQGEPMPDASVYAAIWELKGDPEFPNKTYEADALGIAEIPLPERFRILRLWTRQEDYVDEFVNFALGTHDDGLLVPNVYEFRLARGNVIGGIVKDAQGKPIADATIAVQVDVREPAWTTNPKPIPITYLSNGTKTDEQGRWSIRNAPAEREPRDYTFRLKVTHPDYVGDSQWAELQNSQSVSTEQLRKQAAILRLASGRRIAGRVVDPDGKPVIEGSVFWKTDPFGDSSEYEVKLDEQGKFSTPPLPHGEQSLYVVATGYAPLFTQVDSKNELASELELKLSHGSPLTVRVVGTDDKPIPNARLYTVRWCEAESDDYLNATRGVLDGRIPKRADDRGVYSWDSAPEGGLKFRIAAKGYASKTVTLHAKSREHVVKLDRQLVAYGRVIDAETGEPLSTFKTTVVEQWRDDWFVTQSSSHAGGRNGAYELTLASSYEPSKRYGMRIEAAGYETMITEDFHRGDAGRLELNYQLKPAPARKGFVLTPRGEPAAGATVVECSPTHAISMTNGKSGWGSFPVTSNEEGIFETAATCEPVKLRISHPSGFAEIARRPSEPLGRVKLAEWASVNGQLFQEGKPVAKQRISINPLVRTDVSQPRFQSYYETTTDAEGRFDFPQVPPGLRSLAASLGPWRDSPLTSAESLPLDLKPGQALTANLGGGSHSLSGTVVATGREGVPLAKNWSLNYLIRRDGGISPERVESLSALSFDPRGSLKAWWSRDPGFKDWLSTRERFFVKLPPDGKLLITGVPPGSYDLLLQLYEQPAGCLIETVGTKVLPVEIPSSDDSHVVIDLGTIEVACRAGPRSGEDMRAYRFVDSTGRGQEINDLKGQYVVMHVWASWCAPCLQSMGDIKATVEQFASGPGKKPVTFIGLNMDEEPADGKAAVARGGWNWSQNYLGSESDMARQLAVSSVPTYYLISPDGKLIVSKTSWSELKEVLTQQLISTGG